MKLRYHGLHLLFGVAAALLAVIAWAFWWEPSSLRVTEHPLPLLHWPASQSGLRIAVITDVHAGAPFIDRAKLRKIVTMTNAAHPDLTVLLGDYVIDGIPGGHFIPPEDVARILGGLRAPLGVYGVVGNYDDALGLQRVIRAFDAAGIPMLENRLEHINSGRFHFALLGIDSNSLDLPRIDQQFHLLGADEPVIMLMHHPDVFPMLPARVNLALAGHTHGGQVRLPFFGARITGSMYGQRYLRGHVREQTDMFVSTGIGTSELAVRFGVPPEISLLTLTPDRTPGRAP